MLQDTSNIQTLDLFNDDTTNHDFLAQLPLTPKKDGDASDCDLSDLSSSYWSARVDSAEHFSETHSKHTYLIPKLDLNNLPSGSDDEEIDLNPLKGNEIQHSPVD